MEPHVEPADRVPSRRVRVYGREFDADAYAVRDFLSRSVVHFDWVPLRDDEHAVSVTGAPLDAARLPVPVRWEEHIYLADSDALIELLRTLGGDLDAVLIAGHNPGLHELIFDLVAPERENALFAAAAEKYPTAAFAVLELAIDEWAQCAPGCGTLVHLTRPRDLDPALGPENGR